MLVQQFSRIDTHLGLINVGGVVENDANLSHLGIVTRHTRKST